MHSGFKSMTAKSPPEGSACYYLRLADIPGSLIKKLIKCPIVSIVSSKIDGYAKDRVFISNARDVDACNSSNLNHPADQVKGGILIPAHFLNGLSDEER